jgi:hypothetical protein
VARVRPRLVEFTAVTETGVRSEFSHHGVASRLGRNRADLTHQALDPIVVAGRWLVAGAIAYIALKAVAPSRARR